MRKFIKNKENFICKNCKQFVEGNGYTNHCQNCLFSLHIDKNPGDRRNKCQGLMYPIEIITQGGEVKYVVHQCNKCKIIKRNIISKLDSTEAIIKVMKDKVIREMMH